MSTIDNLLAFKVLYMLVTPFDKTDAFKYGIIDANGMPLKKVKDLSSNEKDSYTALHRLVFNLKKLLAKVPGGKSQFASLVAAYWLIKENHNVSASIRENDLLEIIDLIESKNICMVEEEIAVTQFFKKVEEEGGAIANALGSTGAAVALDQPVIKKKKTLKLFRRQKEGEYVKV